MTDAPRHLVVGRLRKPHGLKGEVTLFPLTGEPEAVFVPGRRLVRMNLEGAVLGAVTIEAARAYHREWLVRFRGLASRDDLESWRGQFLGADAGELTPPGEGEVYLHELAGFAVRQRDGTPLGLISAVYEAPAGVMIEVQGPKREFLVPFRKPFVVDVHRGARVLVVDLPEGLID